MYINRQNFKIEIISGIQSSHIFWLGKRNSFIHFTWKASILISRFKQLISWLLSLSQKRKSKHSKTRKFRTASVYVVQDLSGISQDAFGCR